MCFKISRSIYKATIKPEFPKWDRKFRLLSVVLEAISPESVTQSELASEKITFFFFFNSYTVFKICFLSQWEGIKGTQLSKCLKWMSSGSLKVFFKMLHYFSISFQSNFKENKRKPTSTLKAWWKQTWQCLLISLRHKEKEIRLLTEKLPLWLVSQNILLLTLFLSLEVTAVSLNMGC